MPWPPLESGQCPPLCRSLSSLRWSLSTLPLLPLPVEAHCAVSLRSVPGVYPCRSCWQQRYWFVKSVLLLPDTLCGSPLPAPEPPDSPAPAAASCRIFLRNKCRKLRQTESFSVGFFHGSVLWYVLYCPLLFPLSC